jgi:hypothetical protein
MFVLSWVPLLHVAVCVAMFFVPLILPARVVLSIAVLFLLPPIVARIAVAVAPLERGTYRASDRHFTVWWLTMQLQMIFNRLPLEEVLRIVPGLYSVWLRLWGAKVGRFVFWGPRMTILDRPLIRVGNQAVFGAGARLSGHMITRDGDAIELFIAPAVVGASAVVGAWSVIAPGAEVGEGESLPATMSLAPNVLFFDGRRRTKVV